MVLAFAKAHKRKIGWRQNVEPRFLFCFFLRMKSQLTRPPSHFPRHRHGRTRPVEPFPGAAGQTVKQLSRRRNQKLLAGAAALPFRTHEPRQSSHNRPWWPGWVLTGRRASDTIMPEYSSIIMPASYTAPSLLANGCQPV
jgi:hypothetical protein